ncbi:MAG TPA: BPSS1780 family membrane protein [Usitatibacter sp.]|nr:BPSS1780 family membrane protein [Usitatibacter sp.]
MDASIRVTELRASRGAAWIAEAFQLFRRRPVAWIALCAGWIALTFGLILIPFIGGVVANFLQPVFFASFAIAAYRQSAGEPIAIGDLFGGFRRNVRALVNLGALLLMAEIAIFALMALLGLPMTGPSDQPFTLAEYIETLRDKEAILATGFVLTAIIKGALWFAPPLIAFHDMSTTHAMRWSLYAALTNLGAMLIYGVLLMAFFLAGMVLWGVGLIVVLPLMVISTYVSYRDVFEARDQTLA